jgi:hypothetical protein
MEKLLTLMRRTPWSSPVAEFATTFKDVYGVELAEFERGIVREAGR